MNEIARIRKEIGRDIFDYSALLSALPGFSKPRDKISRLLAAGDIVRIKKGLYSFSPMLSGAAPNRGYLANLIVGPSYVSLDYALAYHGLIPERVEAVTSVTPSRSRIFRTPFGGFSYRMLSGARYSLGAGLISDGGEQFLIATPEKALADKVWADKRFRGRFAADYPAYLSADLRIAEESLIRLDRVRIREIVRAYNSPKISNLLGYLEKLGGSESA